MTDRIGPAAQLAAARQKLVAELDKAQQAKANLEDGLASRQREIAKWDTQINALLLALDILGPAPPRGSRKRAANGATEKRPRRPRKGMVHTTATGERWMVDRETGLATTDLAGSE